VNDRASVSSDGFGLQRGALWLDSRRTTPAQPRRRRHERHRHGARRSSAWPRLGGGIVAVDDGAVLAELPLPVAACSPTYRWPRWSERSRACVRRRRERLGCRGATPFLTMSFLALSGDPEL
jgi:hypothetical protein